MNKRIFIFTIILFVVSSTSLICWNVWHYVPTIKNIPNKLFSALSRRNAILFSENDELCTYMSALLESISMSRIDETYTLFAENAINELGYSSFSTMISRFSDYIDGYTFKVYSPIQPYVHYKRDQQKESEVIEGPLVITTGIKTYYAAVKCISKDDFSPNNVGLWSIEIIDSALVDLNEKNYRGDLRYPTGIYVNVLPSAT